MKIHVNVEDASVSTVASAPSATELRKCLLCNRNSIDEVKYGPFVQKGGIDVHHYCLLFSQAEQNGRDEDGIFGYLLGDITKYVRTVEASNCCYCYGRMASVKCSGKNCSAVFHLPCGLENGSMHRFRGLFQSFCSAHRPLQRLTKTLLKDAQENPPICVVCFDSVDSSNVTDAIWASCCRSTWYHRECIQRLALSSGSLLKCATCRSTTKFKQLLVRLGIYLPKRDASWELVPNAYQELYARHNRCDALECRCPFGRTHTDRKWELILCNSCGSEGVHVNCADQSKSGWECEICRRV